MISIEIQPGAPEGIVMETRGPSMGIAGSGVRGGVPTDHLEGIKNIFKDQ